MLLCARLDDAEDRSRRNNLLFYNIPDIATETAPESEEKVLNLLTNKLALSVGQEYISHARWIGRFSPNRARPLIFNFESHKSKEQILSKHTELKDSSIAVSEDYCTATHQARTNLSTMQNL